FLRRLWDDWTDKPESLGSALASLGVSGLTVPTTLGGDGLRVSDCVLVLEAFGRQGVTEPFADAIAVAAPILHEYAVPEVAEPILRQIAAGELLVTIQNGWDGWAPWARESNLLLVVEDDAVVV